MSTREEWMFALVVALLGGLCIGLFSYTWRLVNENLKLKIARIHQVEEKRLADQMRALLEDRHLLFCALHRKQGEQIHGLQMANNVMRDFIEKHGPKLPPGASTSAEMRGPTVEGGSGPIDPTAPGEIDYNDPDWWKK